MTVISCCSPLNPSSTHHSSRWSSQDEASASTLVKEAGKKLKYDMSELGQLEDNLTFLVSIFESQTPFCHVSLGVRRSCILLINCIQILSVGSEKSLTLAVSLLQTIGHFDPKLISVFIHECIDVLRILRESTTTLSVEVFHNFVSAVRQSVSTATSSTPESNRGIIVPLPNGSEVVQTRLCRILALLIKDYYLFLDEKFCTKLSMYRLGESETERKKICDDIVALFDDDIRESLEELLGTLSGVDENETQMVGETAEGIVGEVSEKILDVLKGNRLSDDLIHDNLPCVIPDAPRSPQISALDYLTSDKIEPRFGLLSLIQRRPWHRHIDATSVFARLVASTKNFTSTLPTVGKLIGELFWRKDTNGLKNLALSSNMSSVQELLVPYLDIPVSIILLCEDQRIFAEFSQYILSLTSYSLSQLIEASSTEVVFRLISIPNVSAETVKTCLDRARSVMATAAPVSGSSLSVKKQKISSPKNPSSAIDSILHENYLQLIHLIEESDYDKSAMFKILLSILEPRTIQLYAVRTVECFVSHKISCWNELLAVFKPRPDLVAAFAPCFIFNGDVHDKQLLSSTLGPLVEEEESGSDWSEFVTHIVDELESPERIPAAKFALVSLLVDRMDKNEFLFFHTLSKLEKASKFFSSLIRLTKHFSSSESALYDCGRLMAKVARFVSSNELGDTSYLNLVPLHTIEGMKKWSANFISTSLLPNIRLNSHAYAVQELIAINGGSVFVQKLFSSENQLVLTPYLTSSYRISSAPNSPSTLSSSGAISNPIGLFNFLSSFVRGQWKPVFNAIRLAVIADEFVCAESLPGLVEVVAYDHVDPEPIWNTLRDASGQLLQSNPKIIFAIFDHLNGLISCHSGGPRIKSTGKEYQFIQGLLTGAAAPGVDQQVVAAIKIGDFERALAYLEKTILVKDEKYWLQVCEIFKGLNDSIGVQGVCDIRENRLLTSLELKTAKRDRLLHVAKGEDRIQALLDEGLFYSVLDAVSTKSEWSSKGYEACWRLSDWSQLRSLVEHPIVDQQENSIDKVICEKMMNLSSQEGIEKLFLETTKKLLGNSSRTNLTEIALLGQVDRLGRFDIETLLDCWSEESGLISPEHAGKIFEFFRCAANCAQNKEFSDRFQTLLRRLYRKTNRLDDLRVQLYSRPSANASVETLCEWARGCWAIGDRETARMSLSHLVSLKPEKSQNHWEAELLLLRWSAEMEIMIPRLVVASYRDLLKRGSDDYANREKIAFQFASYLDSVGGSTDVWNKSVLVKEIAQNYFESIKFDSTGKRLLFTINRLLQLQWEYARGDANQILMSNEIVKVLSTGWNLVPTWVWYLALPQLVSRLTSESPEMVTVVERIVVAVGCEYPRQSGWILAQLLNSKINERRICGQKIFAKIIEKSEYPNIQQFVNVMKIVAESLVGVARLAEMKPTLSETKEGARLLRDTGGLLVMPIQEQISSCAILSSGKFSREIRIGKFLDSVFIYQTKARPKRVSVIDSVGGKQYQFILKVEKKTDLRKDSRTMEFVNVVNHEMRHKQISTENLRTYSVLILSEDCALIEFLPNVTTLRKIIEESLNKIGKNVNMYLNKDVMNKLSNKHEGFAYFQSVVATVPPMIAEWAWNRFGWNPRIWLRNRNVFTQSQALWCIVGYIIGLGDRHPDNILIDEESGEVVHVDFDCIFSRGMSLQIPELVPFRLTRICVSGMGVTGVEGRFRTQCESVLKLLRNKKKTLLAVLHSFIADPLIDWQGSTTDKNGSPTSSFKKAKDVITAIEKKLNGYVDVGEIRPAVPGMADEKLFMYNENAESAKASGLGKDRGAALSVEGQVDELIRAAVCERNLARMYLGWMPLF